MYALVGSRGDFLDTRDLLGQGNVKHVMIMDEVDGMSGNQDRSGIAELILLIRKSVVPVICICNDRHSQKIRSLANYCFDLRFTKPRTEQIRSRILSIACKEGVRLNAQTADQLIEGANHDIRQVIQHLNLLAATNKNLGFDQARSAAKAAHKDVTVNVFEAARQILAGGSSVRGRSLNEKAELFFVDYSLIPLFVHENYIHVVPHNSKTALDHFDAVAQAAESIAVGDTTEKLIRTTQSWSLLNEQAMYSTVIPCDLLNGYMQSQLGFPQWLGKMSTTNKRQRLLNQLQQHSRVRLSGDSASTLLDYIPYLRDAVTDPLVERGTGGVGEVVGRYQAYDLTREDVDTVMELGQWTGHKDPLQNTESKVKAAVTREFNKEKHLLPYSSEQISKGRKGRGGEGKEIVLDEEGNPLRSEEDSQQLTQEEEEEDSGAEAFKKKETNRNGVKGSNNSDSGRGKGRKK